jgi:glutamate-ammonia-ligase adenylyltransferase
MRARMAREFKGTSRWDIKHRRGGLVDVEFISQYLQLRHGHANPEILAPTTVVALDNLAQAGLLDRAVADDLVAALQLWHRVQAILRVAVSDDVEKEGSPEGPRNAVVRAAGVDDFGALTALMDETATRVHGHFVALVEEPADAARPRVEADAEAKTSPTN